MASDEEITPSDERRIEIFKEKLGKILRDILKRPQKIIPKERESKQEKGKNPEITHNWDKN